MFKEKKAFKTNESDELKRKSEILNMFWMNMIHSRVGDERLEVFIKKGEQFKFRGLENIMLYPLVSDESRVCRVNYSDFAKEALLEIDKYRIINNSIPIGEIYKIIDIHGTLSNRIKEEGDYLISADGEPKFKISIESIRKGYIFESVKFSSFDKKEFLKYTPKLLEEKEFRYGVEIEMSVLNRKKNVLFNTYKQILNPKKNPSQ